MLSVCAQGTFSALVLRDLEQNKIRGEEEKKKSLCLRSPIEPKLLRKAEGSWLLRVPQASSMGKLLGGWRRSLAAAVPGWGDRGGARP